MNNGCDRNSVVFGSVRREGFEELCKWVKENECPDINIGTSVWYDGNHLHGTLTISNRHKEALEKVVIKYVNDFMMLF